MASITFQYDDDSNSWDIIATCVTSTEAKQAFTAVVLSVKLLDETLLDATQVVPFDEPFTFELVPTVSPNSPLLEKATRKIERN